MDDCPVVERPLVGSTLGYRMQPIVHLASLRPVAHELLCGAVSCPNLDAQQWAGWYADMDAILRKERSSLPVFINLDAPQASSPDLAWIAQALLENHSCVLEWTERIEADKRVYDAAAARFASWRERGVPIAVDDIGSDFGFDGIGRVLRVLPRYAKIDMGVLWRSRKPDGVDILRHVNALLVGLGCQVIAEGIETQDDLLRCLAAGIEMGQGFFFR